MYAAPFIAADCADAGEFVRPAAGYANYCCGRSLRRPSGVCFDAAGHLLVTSLSDEVATSNCCILHTPTRKLSDLKDDNGKAILMNMRAKLVLIFRRLSGVCFDGTGESLITSLSGEVDMA